MSTTALKFSLIFSPLLSRPINCQGSVKGKKRCCKNKDVLILLLQQQSDLLRTCLLRTRNVNGWSSQKKAGSCKEGGSNAYHHQFFSLSSHKRRSFEYSPKTFNIGYCVIEEEGEEWKRLDLIYRDWDCVSASYYFI